jgi:AP-1 complex subunit sigma 1/2
MNWKSDNQMIDFFLVFNRQGKVRLSKWYTTQSKKEKEKTIREVSNSILSRPASYSTFIEWRDRKLVFNRYASLFFVMCVGIDDNESLALDTIHFYVETLDAFYGNVREVDIVYGFHHAYTVLDELILAGEFVEGSRVNPMRAMTEQKEQTMTEPGKAFEL